jgi:mono/diheme cytochrome c family protein
MPQAVSDRRFHLVVLVTASALTGLPMTGVPSLVGQTTDQGQELFEEKCTACHSLGSDRMVGPGLAGVGERRDREWLVAFVTTPDRLIAEGDSIATRLLAEYQVPMPNLGVTAGEADLGLAYIAGAGDAVAITLGDAPTFPAGDPKMGERLFTGERQLVNGGPSCISCHSINTLQLLGGGTLAKDLTLAAATYGDGLLTVLDQAPFPVMQDIFKERALTPQEVADLAAFLAQVDAGSADRSRVAFPLAGVVGTFFLLVLTGVVWRARLRGVRKPLIGGRS